MSQLPKVKGIADIVFLLDATGSMGPCINAVKHNIKTFVQTLTTPTPNGAAVVKDWRAKVMGYRDMDYNDVPAIVDNPFVSSVIELESQLNALVADGGGDEPETLLEALYMLANMPATGPDEPLRPDAWRHVNSGRRFIILFTDAPFKEPLRMPKDARIDDVILNLMTAKVVLHMFAPATLSRFGTLEEVDKALWYKIPVPPGETAQKALEEYTADQSKFEKIIQLLAKTMTQQSGGETPIAD
jgi:hypothetical protein